MAAALARGGGLQAAPYVPQDAIDKQMQAQQLAQCLGVCLGVLQHTVGAELTSPDGKLRRKALEKLGIYLDGVELMNKPPEEPPQE